VDAISADAYRAKVERVKEYIAAGDIYQANLAQRWAVETSDSAEEIYRRLCRLSPAPYAGFSRFVSGDGVERAVMSASPELFLNVGEGRVITRPIKGTRRRDVDDTARDEALRAELVASEKDKAELAMIVDLMRNDLGRVSEYGSVCVEAAREVEKHPTVWHTVATVSSRLKAGAGLADLLRAVCPGGSITGAPKIRAMQIIEELEGFRRGLYCGNIGAIGAEARTLTLNIAIRTILMQEGMARVFAGGGIVADSDAQAEYDETLVKAAAMLRALGVGGL
jgi:anthranilate/para-aminobenzoate synthase component I